MSPKPPKQLREPVQVYLDREDRALLDELSRQSGLPRTEVLRRGLRRLAQSEFPGQAPGSSFDALLGALGSDPAIPADLAARHDEYLYPDPAEPDADPCAD